MIKHCAKEVKRNEITKTLKELEDCGAMVSSISCSNKGYIIIYRIEESDNGSETI